MTGIAQEKPSTLPQGDELPAVLWFVKAYLPLLVALLLFAAVLLWGRRLSGAFERALSTTTLCLAGVALASGSEFLRRCLTSRTGTLWFFKDNGISLPCYSLGWLPVLSVCLTAGAISLPGSSPWGLAALWVGLLLAGVWAGRSSGCCLKDMIFSSRTR